MTSKDVFVIVMWAVATVLWVLAIGGTFVLLYTALRKALAVGQGSKAKEDSKTRNTSLGECACHGRPMSKYSKLESSGKGES